VRFLSTCIENSIVNDWRGCRLYAVRHGQTQANLEHRYQAAVAPDLTNTGGEQAVNLCIELAPVIRWRVRTHVDFSCLPEFNSSFESSNT
jgi:broad specificity phosphatase PhoE